MSSQLILTLAWALASLIESKFTSGAFFPCPLCTVQPVWEHIFMSRVFVVLRTCIFSHLFNSEVLSSDSEDTTDDGEQDDEDTQLIFCQLMDI